MHTVTPWSLTAQNEIENSDVLLEKKILDYTYEFYNTGDSFWIVVILPGNGKIAFRAAFAMNSNFETVNLFENKDTIVAKLKSELGNYKVVVEFGNTTISMLHYTTTFNAKTPLMIPFWPRDIIPLTQKGRIENTYGNIHMKQVGPRSGLLFASMTKPKTGSLFYFQNLTSISEYCEVTQTEANESVGGEWPEIGFQLPYTKELPIPSGKPFVISDAYILLTPEIHEEPVSISKHFLNNLAEIYKVIPKPKIEYHDWPNLAEKALKDLSHNKGAWSQVNGHPYLNAYLCDYDTPVESMVQLAVLVPFMEFETWSHKNYPLYEDLLKGVAAFYDPKVNCINRWLPELIEELDASEEQKKEMVMDSWYLHHPLMNLSRIALEGNKKAKKLVLDSIDYVIKVAHHFKYDWPVFYNMETLEIIKKETIPSEGGEHDVPGSYAHLMLLIFRLTKEKRYLNEAKKAAKKLIDYGTDIFYQANNTSFAAGALLELFKITKEKIYLDLSYICLAGLFKNMQLHDSQYGNGKNYPNFFSVFPLNDAPYTAAYEEVEVYAGLTEYLIQAKDIDILPSLRILIPEFVKYAVNRIPYYYPSMLPEDMLSKEVKTGEIQPDLWIPLEDLYTGWVPSGQVGQEVYGAGIAFAIVPRQYIKIEDDFLIFIDYPITQYRKRKKSITITLDGDQDAYCNLKIIQNKSHIKVIASINGTNLKPFKKSFVMHEYLLSGKSSLKLKW
jgi:hypothetical protein